ncbi:chemotaxis protein CheW [Acetobacterium sp.]|jgi:purine-binding chemotaxis protein CheW|uniref:chemotaxis protein CheW n=1 Tax=Acetobacterium sp. TaxID=1872094 RepID=UPI000CC4F3BE|nr:chemotaxis protein CheW [Acetobacterium sp.]MDO9492604.1 chemotaxis protein CheW [Acetobacterium sp.]PKM75195.1 MAG: chemotaxis protein CheW [Firmicutes bacterium HGW-Firmicutes-17]
MIKEIAEELDQDDDQQGMYLTFELANEYYGLWVGYVTEIIGILPFTEVPELPAYVRGIFNLRGRIIPLMDMRLRFQKKFVKYDERSCVIVIDVAENTVGLIVDSVSEVITFSEADIIEQPMLSSGVSNQFVKSIGKVGNEVKLLLDCDKLLSNHEIETIINEKDEGYVDEMVL